MLVLLVGLLTVSFGFYTFSGCCKKKKVKKNATMTVSTVIADSKPTTVASQEGMKTDPDLKSKKHEYKKGIAKPAVTATKPKPANLSGQTILKSAFGLPDVQTPSVNVPSMDKDLNKTYEPSKTCDPSRVADTNAPKKSVDKSIRSVTALTADGIGSPTRVTMDKNTTCDSKVANTQVTTHKNTDTTTPSKEKKNKKDKDDTGSTQSSKHSVDKAEEAKSPHESESAKKPQDKKTLDKPTKAELKDSDKNRAKNTQQTQDTKELNHEVSKYF